MEIIFRNLLALYTKVPAEKRYELPGFRPGGISCILRLIMEKNLEFRCSEGARATAGGYAQIRGTIGISPGNWLKPPAGKPEILRVCRDFRQVG